MKKRRFYLLLTTAVICFLYGCKQQDLPFKELSEDEVEKVEMILRPGTNVEITDKEQISELITLINKLKVIKEDDRGRGLSGQFIEFTIIKKDKTDFIIGECSSYIVYQDKYYLAESQGCEELNDFADKLVQQKKEDSAPDQEDEDTKPEQEDLTEPDEKPLEELSLNCEDIYFITEEKISFQIIYNSKDNFYFAFIPKLERLLLNDGGETWEPVKIDDNTGFCGTEDSIKETTSHTLLLIIYPHLTTGTYRLSFQVRKEDGEYFTISDTFELRNRIEADIEPQERKPVIYLYPEIPTDCKVNLELDGTLLCTYPEYQDGWNVTAQPDGSLINWSDRLEYSYLFWEGIINANYDLSKGFVVAAEDTIVFLQEKLAYLGLTPKEYNEFIVYWLPILQQNKFNLITFQEEAYTNHTKLEIIPEPDSILRVFMVYQPLEEWLEMEEQVLKSTIRTGFTVVEWGGAEAAATNSNIK